MAYAEKRGRKFRGMYRDGEGKLRSAGWAEGKRAAVALAQAEELKLRSGDWHDPNVGQVLFSDYFENHWLPNRVIELTTRVGRQLVGLTEIAQRAGTQKQAVSMWQSRHEDFPEPIAVLRTGQVWWWPEVQAWLQKTGRRFDAHLSVEEVNRASGSTRDTARELKGSS
jgi:hypothetical protein